MKRVLKLLLLVLILSISDFPLLAEDTRNNGLMSDDYSEIINSVSIDSLVLYLRHLTGEEPFGLDGKLDSIKSRYSYHEDFEKARKYIEIKLKGFGYDVELQEVNSEVGYSDLYFSPRDNNIGLFIKDFDPFNMYKTTDGGNTWEQQPNEDQIYSIHPAKPGLVIGESSNKILKSTNCGDSWEVMNLPISFLDEIFFINDSIGWISTFVGDIVGTNDGGDTWKYLDSLPVTFLRTFCFFDVLNGIAISSKGKIFRTTDGGNSWICTMPGEIPEIRKVLCVNDSVGFLIGSFGVLKSTDKGAIWNLVDCTKNISLIDIELINDNEVIAVGFSGTILRTSDGGNSWVKVYSPRNINLLKIEFINETEGIVIGNSGYIIKTTDAGCTWNELPLASTFSIKRLEYLNKDTIWILGNGIFAVSRNGGNTWHELTDEFGTNITYNIIATKDGNIYNDSFVVLCAHYDSISGVDSLAPGADDNASGTAAVIETARIIADYELSYTCKFVLFSTEEVGLYGSRNYVNDAYLNEENIIAAINLDMIAYDSDDDRDFDIHDDNSDKSEKIALIFNDIVENYSVNLKPELLNDDSYPSDNYSFWNVGYPAVSISENHDDFNNYYHTTKERISNLNIPYYHEICKLIAVSFAELADNGYGTHILEKEIGFLEIKTTPNPFSEFSVVSYQLSEAEPVKIVVYNSLGREIAILVDESQESGRHEARFDASGQPQGVYYYTILIGGNSHSGKMVLVR